MCYKFTKLKSALTRLPMKITLSQVYDNPGETVVKYKCKCFGCIYYSFWRKAMLACYMSRGRLLKI